MGVHSLSRQRVLVLSCLRLMMTSLIFKILQFSSSSSLPFFGLNLVPTRSPQALFCQAPFYPGTPRPVLVQGSFPTGPSTLLSSGAHAAHFPSLLRSPKQQHNHLVTQPLPVQCLQPCWAHCGPSGRSLMKRFNSVHPLLIPGVDKQTWTVFLQLKQFIFV